MKRDAPNPYTGLAPTAYWRSAVAETGIWGLTGLWKSKWVLPTDARFSTYGSCFAQHISRALVARKLNWCNAEPAPARAPAQLALDYGYGVFSARTANIYTTAQLVTHLRMATGALDPDAIEIWPDAARFRDSLRPMIEPGGFATEAELRLSRQSMVHAFCRSVTGAEVFVFTLGLTEGWQNIQTGQCYPLCPGTSGGVFDADAHALRNQTYPEVYADMQAALAMLWALNPKLRVLLTVSPVPLTATATADHVLVATTYSKSTLRAVAGDLARADARVDYFPSYEIIAGAPARAGFFEPNMRGVAKQGVDLVMTHFFAGLDTSGPAERAADTTLAERESRIEAVLAAEDLVCEEMVLEQFNAS